MRTIAAAQVGCVAVSAIASKHKRAVTFSWLLFFLLSALASPLLAEGDRREVVPEVDAFVKVSDRTRVFLYGSVTRELTEDVTDGEAGAHLDFTLKPILRSSYRQGDWERERYLWMRVGYVVAGDLDNRSDGSTEHRGVFEVTARLPLPHEIWLVNRFRLDLRDVNDKSSKRYRYRLGIQREFSVGGQVWVSYAEGENFYDTRYDAWTRQLYQAGMEIALTKTWRIESYFAHQNDQRSESGNLNRIGLVLKYYR